MIGCAENPGEWEKEIRTPEQGCLALVSCVLQQAVGDVAWGMRNGILTPAFGFTAKRIEGDESAPRQALRFLQGPDAEMMCDLVRNLCGVPVTPAFLLASAKRKGMLEVKAKGGPRRLADMSAEEKARREKAAKEYQRAYGREWREKRRQQRRSA